jgi:hypothetical protein
MLRRALPLALLAPLAALAQPAPANDPSFRVVNNTAKVINEVYASPANQPDWGHDRLGSEVVPPGGRQIVRLPPGGTCSWDVRVVYQGGGAEERRNLNTCGLVDLVLGGGGAAPRGAQQGNPSFNLVNQSGRVIEQFYASPTSAQGWGPDRLGESTMVPPGQYQPVRLPQGECSYDLRWVWQGGQAGERRNVNACTTTNYVVK